MATISERLRRENADFGQRPRGFCNPDGPDGADVIDALVDALEYGRDRLQGNPTHVADALAVVDAALALARGEK